MLRFQLSTLIFQLVNFFVLLAALTWFFYRPLLRMMRQREEDIRGRLRDAEERAAQAERERQALAAERQRAHADAEAVLARAREDAARQRDQVLEQAQRDAATSLDEARRRSEEQERTARALLEAEASRTAIAVASRLLARIPVTPCHEALLMVLLDRGLDGDPAQTEVLRRALAVPGTTVTVELAVPPTPELEVGVRRRLAASWGVGQDRPTVFRVEPSLIAGGRILVGTVVVELSLRAVLNGLERDAIQEEAHA